MSDRYSPYPRVRSPINDGGSTFIETPRQPSTAVKYVYARDGRILKQVEYATQADDDLLLEMGDEEFDQ